MPRNKKANLLASGEDQVAGAFYVTTTKDDKKTNKPQKTEGYSARGSTQPLEQRPKASTTRKSKPEETNSDFPLEAYSSSHEDTPLKRPAFTHEDIPNSRPINLLANYFAVYPYRDKNLQLITGDEIKARKLNRIFQLLRRHIPQLKRREAQIITSSATQFVSIKDLGNLEHDIDVTFWRESKRIEGTTPKYPKVYRIHIRGIEPGGGLDVSKFTHELGAKGLGPG